MANVKITIIGGGSWTWTPGLVASILNSNHLDGCRVVPHGVAPCALDVSQRPTTMVLERSDSSITITKTLDQAEALDGADFVLVTISTGGLGGTL